jgi:hypothetical protein
VKSSLASAVMNCGFGMAKSFDKMKLVLTLSLCGIKLTLNSYRVVDPHCNP